ncbi:MAG: hypothetical protein H7Y42_13115 [Chitinophagaceae bacterium]|nr:hypothetical protein [Chitinophagaceae bacterium]
MRKIVISVVCIMLAMPCFSWGFFAHRKINYYAVFLLPPEMMVFYKPNVGFLEEHAVDPDKRRYLVQAPLFGILPGSMPVSRSSARYHKPSFR